MGRHRLLESADPVGVAVSGGADSVALLHALRSLLSSRPLAAIHVNHCLRGAESDADEAFVRDLAKSLECGWHVRRQDVRAAAARTGGNLEQAGRDCRYRFFREVVAGGSCAVVATAHTRSDQAETVLFRLLRGSAGSGLSAIRPVREPGIIRPMLDVSRDEVRAYLRSAGLPWREDSSNRDQRYARNRVRHFLLPWLKREWNPQAERVLANTANWALEEERYWESRTAALLSRCVREDGGAALVEVATARDLHPAELRRLLDAVLRSPRFHPGRAGFDHIEAVRKLVEAPSGSGAVDLPGARAERSFGQVRIVPRSAARAAAFDVPLPVPGVAPLPGAGGVVRTRLLDPRAAGKLYNAKESAFLDWNRVPNHLRVRNWRAGDRYRPVGRQSSRKISALFGQHRISAWERASWPVVTAAPNPAGPARIVWARTFGPAHDLAAAAADVPVLAVDEVRGAGPC